MLMEHTRMYVLPQAKDELPPAKEMPDMQNPGFMDTPAFQLSTFYTVALTYDGEILDIKNEQPALHTDEELEQLAKIQMRSFWQERSVRTNGYPISGMKMNAWEYW